ncbi:hypothetical protein GDO86_017073 [Hymenochirus boettgeri]|uniref:Caspase-8 n=1 Tax=Hymenochirus boettgeri TaxID=247094 RepID=A0A8T2IP84_9PIPI|nr:hypothetical protein GDO86_017073 [Hymenochirus boettgeri]
MEFNSMLLHVEDDLGHEDVEVLKFLCIDLVSKNKLKSVRSGQELFQQLMNKDLINSEDFFLLAELLYITKHYSTLQLLHTTKENVQDALPKHGKISAFRQFLYELSENISADDERSIVFLLPLQKRSKENKTFLEVLNHLEKEQLIREDNVELLENAFKKVSPEVLKQITAYKNHYDDKAENIDHQLSELHLHPKITKSQTEVYDMNNKCRGYCLIINNSHFMTAKKREGTDKDANELQSVFLWLLFDVKIVKDQNSEEIYNLLEKFHSKDHSDRDCFVCCILTHGESGTVLGVDDKVVPIREIMSYFTATKCKSLALKPKLFFIQACQGNQPQPASNIESDAKVPEETKPYVENIPQDADFLLGMSTVDGYASYRDRNKGSWYIQALCKNLVEMVPRHEDILSILTKVNKDVSKMEHSEGRKKQMPQPSYTLRKKLIFPEPSIPFISPAEKSLTLKSTN